MYIQQWHKSTVGSRLCMQISKAHLWVAHKAARPSHRQLFLQTLFLSLNKGRWQSRPLSKPMPDATESYQNFPVHLTCLAHNYWKHFVQSLSFHRIYTNFNTSVRNIQPKWLFKSKIILKAHHSSYCVNSLLLAFFSQLHVVTMFVNEYTRIWTTVHVNNRNFWYF